MTGLCCFYCLQICNAEFIKFTPSFLLLFYGVKFGDSDVRDPRKFNSCFIFFARFAASAVKIENGRYVGIVLLNLIRSPPLPAHQIWPI